MWIVWTNAINVFTIFQFSCPPRTSGGPLCQPSPALAPWEEEFKLGFGCGPFLRSRVSRATPAPVLVRLMLFRFSRQKKQLSTMILVPSPARWWPLVTSRPWVCWGEAGRLQRWGVGGGGSLARRGGLAQLCRGMAGTLAHGSSTVPGGCPRFSPTTCFYGKESRLAEKQRVIISSIKEENDVVTMRCRAIK